MAPYFDTVLCSELNPDLTHTQTISTDNYPLLMTIMDHSTTCKVRPANWHDLAPTYPLSPLDFIMPPVYIHLVLVFSISQVEPALSISEIVESFHKGVAQTLGQFPHLNGRIRTSTLDGSTSLTIPITEPDSGVRVVQRFLSEDPAFHLSYDDLESAHFPITKFDPTYFAPVDIMSAGDDAEAFAVQLTFIRGGVVLVPCLHHALADGTGFDIVVKYLSDNISAATANSTIIPPEIIDRTLLCSTFSTDHRSHPEFTILPEGLLEAAITADSGTSTHRHESRVYSFSIPEIVRLKAAAEESASDPASKISTYNYLCAILWRSHMCIRSQTGSLRDVEHSLLGMPVNSRRNVALPENWFGNAITNALTTLPISAFDSTELDYVKDIHEIAAAIRASIDAVRIDGHLASVCSFIASVPDKRLLVPSFAPPGNQNVIISSWEGMKSYEHRFGALGFPQSIRVCQSTYDGMTIVLPGNKASQRTEVVISLLKEEWDVLDKLGNVFQAGELLAF